MRVYFALFFFAVTARANLMGNSSFESYSSCPDNYGEITRADQWSSPTLASPDYFNSCSGSTQWGTPTNGFGTQAPASGAAYTFVRVWGNVPANTTPNYREYIQGQLSSPLVAGQTYAVSFLVSLADVAFTPIVQMGAYLSPALINLNIGATSNGVLNVTPQVVHSGTLLSDAVNWAAVTGTFTAAGGEDYIIIGNFLDDASTTAGTGGGFGSIQISGYFIDDVSVEAAVPEPGTLALSLGGAILMGFWRIRQVAARRASSLSQSQ